MDGRKAAGTDGHSGKDGKVKVYKGFYEGIVRLDFSVDEKTPGLRPFNELKAEIEDGDLTKTIADLLQEELGFITTVSVKQTGANLKDIPERAVKRSDH